MVHFEKRILFVGYGAVAQCALPILMKLVQVPAGNITVMDFEDRSGVLQEWTSQGVHWVQDRVTPENMGRLLAKYVGPGDMLIDLAWNIDACEILQWCHDHGVLYINTSTEIWDPYTGAADKHPTEMTLYWRHMNLRRMIAGWKTQGPDGRHRARRQPRPHLPFRRRRASSTSASKMVGNGLGKGADAEHLQASSPRPAPSTSSPASSA